MFRIPPEEGDRFADNFESWTEACERTSAEWRRKRKVFIVETVCSVIGALLAIWLFSGRP